jgi:hypothetical protein
MFEAGLKMPAPVSHSWDQTAGPGPGPLMTQDSQKAVPVGLCRERFMGQHHMVTQAFSCQLDAACRSPDKRIEEIDYTEEIFKMKGQSILPPDMGCLMGDDGF